MEYVTINSTPDKQDSEGKWLAGFVVPKGDGETPEYHVTRGYVLWNNMNKRCIVGGAYQKDRPSYQSATVDFIDSQHFITWCQDQYGYMKRDETGKFWQLDKDLLSIGNMSYSPETCCFVPHRINMAINTSQGSRGNCPIGVSINKRGYIRASYKRVHLGIFKTVEDAHKAWQIAASESYRRLAEDEDLGITIQQGLIQRAEYIENDYEFGRITDFSKDLVEDYTLTAYGSNTIYESVNVV